MGGYYNVISEREHQVTMKLKEGVMWDHVGTYMEVRAYMSSAPLYVPSHWAQKLGVPIVSP